ncbi:MAG: hypothetical protein J5I93_20285 [Pirellulaceae bacterium]|nr:hypothetical protein [Pirellulaceae bacterium]
MRPLMAAVALICCFAGPALAECDCGYPEQRPQPCRRCIEKHVYVPVAPPQPEVSRPEGGYAAPPQTGIFAGESAGMGLEGMEIEFPKLSFKFPSIRFPRLTHFRQGPRMLVESAEAPWVENFRDEAAIEVARPEAGRAPETKEAGPAKPCDLPPKPPCAAQPASDAAGSQLAALDAQLGARLAQLREMEQRLDAKVDRLAATLEQLNRLETLSTARLAQPAAGTGEAAELPANGVSQPVSITATSAGEPRRLPATEGQRPAAEPGAGLGGDNAPQARAASFTLPGPNRPAAATVSDMRPEAGLWATGGPAVTPPAKPPVQRPTFAAGLSQLGRNLFGPKR